MCDECIEAIAVDTVVQDVASICAAGTGAMWRSALATEVSGPWGVLEEVRIEVPVTTSQPWHLEEDAGGSKGCILGSIGAP